MKVLVFPFGSSGDVHPFLGLALALRRRGHDVTFLTCGYFKDLVERAGLPFVEQGTAEEFLAQTTNPDLWHPYRGFTHIFRAGIVKAMAAQFDYIADHQTSGQTLLINNCLGFGVRCAQEKFGLPLVTVHCQPSVMWSVHESPHLPGMRLAGWLPRWVKRAIYHVAERYFVDPVTCPETNRFRGARGLPPMGETTRWWHSPDANLGLFPSWYAAPQPDWPANTELAGFPLWDEATVRRPQPELDAFLKAGTPPIVFTPGSANRHATAFFEAAVEACRHLERRGLLLTRFPEQTPRFLPPTVRHFDYVPLSEVLPRSAALVHHGGIGTAAQAMRAGVPQLVMPLAHDQPDNASRLRRLGVGDWLAPSDFRGAAVASVLDRLLTSPHVQTSCAAVARRFDNDQSLDLACAFVEKLASKRNLL